MPDQKNNSAVNDDMRALLSTPEIHNAGSYWVTGRNKRECHFVVSICATPLLHLMDAASVGCRVYELMSITRPGDILNYLNVNFESLNEELMEDIEHRAKSLNQHGYSFNKPLVNLPFLTFDSFFISVGDDEFQHVIAWRSYLENTPSWYEKLSNLLLQVVDAQNKIRQIDNYLLRHEIELIDHKIHKRDFIAMVTRSSVLHDTHDLKSIGYQDFYTRVAKLAAKDDVQSISCSFGGFKLWRVLVEAQVKRAKALGVPLEDALWLSGPDHGLDRFTIPEDWGGNVHIPYEGMTDGDVVFLPGWRSFEPKHASASGSLSKALGSHCKYLFTPIERDFGELGCAIRLEVDDWILYTEIDE